MIANQNVSQEMAVGGSTEHWADVGRSTSGLVGGSSREPRHRLLARLHNNHLPSFRHSLMSFINA